ncbi:MAG: selenocysteine-specific translation elongation factor [Candidatus Delongbacteria bacterium]|nr:selenocysteine-specific translation elongation factor [Candidatus Delongbacteria bacterium]MCG2759911.1 selenocysteine-specific translation elongation factor [Candidatus Delongbacteria bacterium]
MSHFIIGTAGHIDHGKTSLVKALTGMDTDVLKEEKERNITIDIGFAFLGNDITIIDVPGHERFIKNMMAGVSTIDFTLFVIAADDGIMPQTREHLDILNLLQVKDGVIVLTKADMVEPDWLELVQEEIKDCMKGTFLEGKEIFVVDSISGKGIEELKNLIFEKKENKPPRMDKGIFKLPIDRVFTMKGFGTIITGTILSGKVKEGDKLSIQPQNKEVRVKGLQSHGVNKPELVLGDRAAINLHGIAVEEIERGNVLVSSGYLEPSYIFVSKFYLLNSAKKLQSKTRVRVHAGTNEVLGRIIFLDREELEPGQSCFAELRLEEQMNISPEERFVIRSYSPQITIGGGQILTINEKKAKRYNNDLIEVLTALEKGDQNRLVEETVFLSRNNAISLSEISKKVAWSESETEKAIVKLLADNKIIHIGKDIKKVYFHSSNYEEIKAQILRVVNKFHAEFSHKQGISKEELRTKISTKLNPDVFDAVITDMSKETVNSANNLINLKNFTIKIDTNMQDNLSAVLKNYKESGFKPLTIKELSAELNLPFKDIKQFTAMMTANGDLVKLDDELFISKDTLEKGKEIIKSAISRSGPLKLGQISELLDSTRKFVVPIMEYLDKTGFTKRNGDFRELGE